jgi:tetratricopeptide (TPR) repeat protein
MDDVYVYNRLGIALRKQGKWEEAVKEYQKALKVNSDDEAIHFNMGRAYLEGKRKALARECFQKVLKINPELNEAKAELQKC